MGRAGEPVRGSPERRHPPPHVDPNHIALPGGGARLQGNRRCPSVIPGGSRIATRVSADCKMLTGGKGSPGGGRGMGVETLGTTCSSRL